jgi:hypothetical protein
MSLLERDGSPLKLFISMGWERFDGLGTYMADECQPRLNGLMALMDPIAAMNAWKSRTPS